MIINAIPWDVSPEIFSFGFFSIRWYSILFVGGFIVGYFILKRIFTLEQVPLQLLDRLVWYMAFGTLIGARLGHCLFYEPEYYLYRPFEILKIWEGGLASHGAAIGILIALFLFSLVEKQSYLWVLDRVGIVTALGGCFIRLGNLMNSEVYGVDTSLPWGFVFIRAFENIPKHPTQIYEALSYLCIFILLYRVYMKNREHLKNGFLFGLFLATLFAVRFLIEFVKEDQVAFEKGLVLNMGQLLSIPFILAGIYFMIRPSDKTIDTDKEKYLLPIQ